MWRKGPVNAKNFIYYSNMESTRNIEPYFKPNSVFITYVFLSIELVIVLISNESDDIPDELIYYFDTTNSFIENDSQGITSLTENSTVNITEFTENYRVMCSNFHPRYCKSNVCLFTHYIIAFNIL
ncbi:hypothetical protein BCR32DRAFT_246612 [Anaeromyces robustus]|uniref:Uncharacterized protein n=1 Tax=Anaeromyces robustus TaxID=1754192 RepID=A0A1Y1X002_9FUNG|nr:hypothetical protein BCR32DRAFT_246612 [Anaeromyces robustus]|eukprot:ORX79159.1 hypothetical protein BCR32DRAFT_246612 [Anaeromyces robustus]